MRVFLASHSSANTPILPSSRIWYINFNLTLEQMGIVTPSYNQERCGSAHQDTRLEIRDLNYLNKESQSNGSNLH
jgi:hypothetical protein